VKVIRGRDGEPTREATGTFTGQVFSDAVLRGAEGVRVSNIFFTPCARTYWHSHENGQLIRVFRGRGFVCTKGQEPVEITEGDTVWVPAGETHWHGGARDSLMAHTVVSLGETTWMEEVTEEEYAAAAH